MSNNPDFFRRSTGGGWLAFGAMCIIAALIFPYLWGLYFGVGIFYAFFYTYYKMMGG